MTKPATTVEDVMRLTLDYGRFEHLCGLAREPQPTALTADVEAALKALIAERDQAVTERDAALAEVERLREAIKFQPHDNQNCMGLCGWCDIQRSTSECNHENCIWIESGGEE